jgi:hypothetical protein
MNIINAEDYIMSEESLFEAWDSSEAKKTSLFHASTRLPKLNCNTNHATALSHNSDRCMILVARKHIPYTKITKSAAFSNLYNTSDLTFARMRRPNGLVTISYDDARKAYREAVEYTKSPSGLPVPTFDIIIGFTNDSYPIYIGEKYFIVNPKSFEITHVAVTAYERGFAMSNNYFIYKDKGAAIEAYKELVSKCEVKVGDIVIDVDQYLESGTKVYYRLLEKCERLPEKCPQTDADCYVAVAYANFKFPEVEGKKVDVKSYKPTCVCSKDSIRSITEAEQKWLDMRPKNVNIKMGDLIQVICKIDGVLQAQLAVITGFPALGLAEVLYSENNDLVFNKRAVLNFTDIINSFGNFESLPQHIKQWFQKVARVEGDIVKQCRKEVVKPIVYKELDVVEFTMFDKAYIGVLSSEIVDNVFAIKFNDEIVENSTLWINSIVGKDKIIRKLGTLKPGLNKPESLVAIEKLVEANKAVEPKFVLTLDNLVSWKSVVESKSVDNQHFELANTAIKKGEAYKKLCLLVSLVNQVESKIEQYFRIRWSESNQELQLMPYPIGRKCSIPLAFNNKKGAEFSLLNHKELWLQILTNDTTNQFTSLSA